jgi:hypothetical protein
MRNNSSREEDGTKKASTFVSKPRIKARNSERSEWITIFLIAVNFSPYIEPKICQNFCEQEIEQKETEYYFAISNFIAIFGK